MRPILASTLLVLAALAGCAGDEPAPTTSSPAAPSAKSCDNENKTGLTLSVATNAVVALATLRGCIVAELYDTKAPITTANFKKLVNASFYQDLLFHRIVKDFMIQTGGMKSDGKFKESPFPPIKNEAKTSGLKNKKYTLSMARLGPSCQGCPDQPDSATNQFFINTEDNTNLDPTSSSAGYAVFGIVLKGRDVVDQIESSPVTLYNAPGANPHCQPEGSPSCPKQDINLHSIRLL